MAEQFEILPEHIDLLRAMHWRWDDCEFGVIGVDPKRPFRSSRSYHRDMATAVGWVYDEDDQEQEDELGRLYRETLDVLMIGLSAGSLLPGTYRRAWGQADWTRAEDQA